MKKKLSLLLAASIFYGVMLTACSSNTAPSTEPVPTGPDLSQAMFKQDPAEDGVFRILMIGNSACHYFCDELYAMLVAEGMTAEVYSLYYSGCSVKTHWEWLKSNTANYRLRCHSERGYEDMPDFSLEQALKMRNWDVITLQQAVFPQMCYHTESTLNVTVPYVDNLWNYIKPKFPLAKHLWHQVWAFEVGFVPLAGDKENSPDEYKVLDVNKRDMYYNMLCAVADAVCKAHDTPLIPTGDAWEIARKDPLIGQTLCARKGVNGNLGDYGHDGDIGGGQYLNACVWFEILTGKSCLGNTWRPSYELSEEKITVLQSAAHQAVEALK